MYIKILNAPRIPCHAGLLCPFLVPDIHLHISNTGAKLILCRLFFTDMFQFSLQKLLKLVERKGEFIIGSNGTCKK
jgi:hypothetical protein